MVLVTVKPRSKSIKGFSEEDASIEAILKKTASASKLDTNRIRLTYKKQDAQVPLDASKSWADYFSADELLNGVTVYAKDLGPQIDYKMVFILEYLGPIVLQVLVRTYFTKVKGVPQSLTQTLAYWMVLLHFTKREFETLFVHRFSNATMPLFNLFKNSAHYWFLSGINLALCLYSHDVTQLASDGAFKRFLFHVNSFSTPVNYALVALWVYAQASNFLMHVKLASLRSKDSKAYVIPKGYGFDLLVCPNYSFESLGWLTFSILVGNWSAWLFFIVGTGQMYIWAVARKKRYLKTFGDDFKKLKRAVYIPYLL